MRRLLVPVALLLLGSACGGGSGGSETTNPPGGAGTEATQPASPTSTEVSAEEETPPDAAEEEDPDSEGAGTGTFTMGRTVLSFTITDCGNRPDSDTMTFDLLGEGDEGFFIRVSEQIRDDGGMQQNIDVNIGGGYIRAVRVERDGQWTEQFGTVEVEGPLLMFDANMVSSTATYTLVREFEVTESGFSVEQVGEGTVEATCT